MVSRFNMTRLPIRLGFSGKHLIIDNQNKSTLEMESMPDVQFLKNQQLTPINDDAYRENQYQLEGNQFYYAGYYHVPHTHSSSRYWLLHIADKYDHLIEGYAKEHTLFSVPEQESWAALYKKAFAYFQSQQNDYQQARQVLHPRTGARQTNWQKVPITLFLRSMASHVNRIIENYDEKFKE